MIGKNISHYKILEKLGQGGMGVVYKAEDIKLDRLVALKFLPSQLATDENDKARFLQEAKAASAINHPNVCVIHDIQECDGELFIVMEYVEGKTLREIICKSLIQALNLREVISYAVQIPEALAAAHGKGVIHRDVKSENIMVTPTGQIKVMDFGLAKLKGALKLTKTASTMGTVAYMSPEQIQSLEVDARSDIFSFGVVLYEMLTGQLPFRGEYEQAVMYLIVNQEPEPIEKHRSDISPELVEIIGRALQKRPEDRYQAMSEIKETLQEAAGVKAEGKVIFKTPKPAAKHNLPIQLTSFIGREREIAEVKLLISKHRLVTLTGAGGCGKTRLALKIATDIIAEFADGVWLVELASISDPKLVAHAIAGALQIKEEPNTPLFQTVTKRLLDKRLLLLIDNCEHLIATCSELIESLMKTLPTLAILATSRESLNISGEMVWKVPSLSMPDITKLPSMVELTSFDAIQLFIDRAKTCQPTFALSPQNAESVAKICFRLDGIPLAIELAVARLKLFNPDEILKRLYDRFYLLTGGSRTALERQKTLQATVDWSYELLSDLEKRLFHRLSVFVGGCDMPAIEMVCADESVTKDKIFDLVSSLIDKSLILTETEKDGSYRYRLLETIRIYASQKLLEIGEAAQFRDRHFQYYLNLAEHAYENHFGMEIQWADRLEADNDNLIAALEWVKNQPQQQLVLAGALAWFWYYNSRHQMGIDYLQNAITAAKSPDDAYARALHGIGAMYTWLCRWSEATPFLEKSLAIWRRLNRHKEIGLVLLDLAHQIIGVTGDLSKYIKYYEESVAIFRKLSEDKLAFRVELFLSAAYIYNFDADRAEPLVKKNLDTAIKLNLPYETMANRHYFADCALIKENYVTGEKRYAEALKAVIEMGDVRQTATEMQGMAMNIAGQKRYIKALRLNAAAMKKMTEIGMDITGIKFWNILLSRTIGVAREIFGEQATAAAENDGRQMGFEKACEYALDFEKD